MTERTSRRGLISWAEGLETGFTYAVDLLLLALLWIALVPLRWRDVRLRKYDRGIASAPDHDVAPAAAELLFKTEREDSAVTDEKTRLLLTLTTSLTTIALVFGGQVQPRWLFVGLVGLLIASVLLCLSVFEVRRGMMLPTPEDSSHRDRSREWARDLMASYYANRATHAFRVDRYRAALRYFRLALLLTPVLAALSKRQIDRDAPGRSPVILVNSPGSLVVSDTLRCATAHSTQHCEGEVQGLKDAGAR